ncbi:MAG: hypothetical protein DWQ07_15750 [Chloroflexi bacterium]|nr:MAG: hypothetical protein DWQ07_15750 [Chloroflexota bacterium]MBL1195205.1 hypothetical protein [Chloroflexota bacterium]NOH12490.1 hypothetical protein [Chloroflexota bacterium]
MRLYFNKLYHLAKADFLERIRRSSFLVVVAIIVYIGYLYVPPPDANYLTLAMGPYRGVYNSAWIGTMFGFLVGMIAPLFLFYLIKNTITRDERTRVGQVIATTPISKASYLFGKWLSNLAVLCLVLLILTMMAGVMQLIRAEDMQVNLIKLAMPIWMIGFPVMGAVAALAVLFESVGFLKGGFGNVVYYMLFMFGLVFVMEGLDNPETSFVTGQNDILGVSRSLEHIQSDIKNMDPDYQGSFSIGASTFDEDISVIEWQGMEWDGQLILERISWLPLAFGIVLGAAIPFGRFDPARGRQSQNKKSGWFKRFLQGLVPQFRPGEKDEPDYLAAINNNLADLEELAVRGQKRSLNLLPVVMAELRMMLRGHAWWWYLVLVILNAVGLGLSFQAGGAAALLPFAWVWPILVWSSMGSREAKNYTETLVFSAPQPLRRQLLASWLAGVFVALVASSGFALSLLVTGSFANLMALLVGALFIPSLALALGVWNKTSRLFEIVYLMWWYIAINGVPALDFMGVTQEAIDGNYWLTYLLISVGLFSAAWFGRRRVLER